MVLLLLLAIPISQAITETPDVLLVQAGVTDAGDVVSLQVPDTNWLNVSELAGNPALEEFYNYTSVNLPVGNTWNFSILGSYVGGPAHEVYYYVWNYTSTDWIQLFQIPNSALPNIYYSATLISSNDLISGGIIQTMLNHTDIGINTHDLYVDYAPIDDANCTGCFITFFDPVNKTYASSVDIPLDVGMRDCGEAWYTITGGLENYSVPCNVSTYFDVDLDKDYVLTMYIENITDGTVLSGTIGFAVDRETEASPIYFGLGLFFLLIVGYFFVAMTKSFDDDKYIFKGFLLTLGGISVLFAIMMFGYGLREYVKIPNLIVFLDYYLYIMNILIFITFFLVFLFLIKYQMEIYKTGGK